MAVCWRLEDIQQLRELPRSDRTEIWAAMIHNRVRDRYMLALLVPYFLVVILGNYLGELFIPVGLGGAIGGGLGAGLAIWLLQVIAINRSRPFLMEEARRRLATRR